MTNRESWVRGAGLALLLALGVADAPAGETGNRGLSPITPITQAVQTQQQAPVGSTKIDRTIGACQLIENPPDPPGTAVNALSPVTSVWSYLQTQERLTPKQLTDDMFNTAKATLLQGPKHGSLEYLGEGYFVYRPTPDNIGTDRATVLVEIGGRKIKVVYHFNVTREAGGGTDGYDPYMQKKNCPKGREWKISLPNSPTDTSTIQSLLTFTGITSATKIGVSDLAGGAVGQTVGTTIALAINAAGHQLKGPGSNILPRNPAIRRITSADFAGRR